MAVMGVPLNLKGVFGLDAHNQEPSPADRWPRSRGWPFQLHGWRGLIEPKVQDLSAALPSECIGANESQRFGGIMIRGSTYPQ